MHSKVIDKIMLLVTNYGGHKDDTKLRKMIESLDFSVYTRKTGNQEVILVLTEDYVKEARGTPKF